MRRPGPRYDTCRTNLGWMGSRSNVHVRTHLPNRMRSPQNARSVLPNKPKLSILTKSRSNHRSHAANDRRGFHRLNMDRLRRLESTRNKLLLLALPPRFSMFTLLDHHMRYAVLP